MPEASILFLGKRDDAHCARALAFVRSNFRRVESHLGVWGDPLPESAARWEGDYILSYLSRWVVPEQLIGRAAIAAINFHPAPPSYPGIGCVNFALYDGAAEYGATCHHMVPTVDAGPIVAVARFPVLPDDDVVSLLARTYDAQFAIFEEVMGCVIAGSGLPSSSETWTRPAYTRKEFNRLFQLNADMSEEELRRRIRATSYGVYKPTLTLHGIAFQPKD